MEITNITFLALTLFFFGIVPAWIYLSLRKRYQVTYRYEGLSRLPYFIIWLIIGFMVFVVFGGFSANRQISEVSPAVSLIVSLLYVIPVRYRFINIGFPPTWAYLAIIPGVSLYISLIALFCPPLMPKTTRKTKTDPKLIRKALITNT